MPTESRGVRRSPAREEDNEARNNDGNGGTHIAKDVQSCRTHIEIVFLFLKAKTNIQVHDNADARRQKHDQWLNGFRMLEALHGFIENPDGNQDERQRIDEGGKDADPMVAEGLTSIGRFFGLSRRKPGKAESNARECETIPPASSAARIMSVKKKARRKVCFAMPWV